MSFRDAGCLEAESQNRLLIVRPHPEDFHRPLLWQDLIHESVLDVDSSREGAREVSHELFESGWLLAGIRPEDFEELFGLFTETAGSKLPCVFLRLPRKDDLPGPGFVYQPGRFEVLERGVRNPLRIDSRIPGIERR